MELLVRRPGGFDLGYGGKNWGNFFEVDGLNTGRFLDPPEFAVFHDKGNEENFFDRVDYQFTQVDSIHLNLNYSRSWFQTPNAYDNLNVSECGQRRQRQPTPSSATSAIPISVEDRDLQYRADLYARDQQQLGPQLWRLRPQGCLQLLSQRQSPGGSGSAKSADLIHRSVPYADQCRCTRISPTSKGSTTSRRRGVLSRPSCSENDNLGVVDATYNSPCVDATAIRCRVLRSVAMRCGRLGIE